MKGAAVFGNKSTETVVVGAGPVGMVCALFLARAGIETVVIDAAPGPCTKSNAVVLHPQTLRLFGNLGFADRVKRESYAVKRVMLYDDHSLHETLRLDETGFPPVFTLPQSKLESILEDELARRGVTVLWRHRLVQVEQLDAGVKADVVRTVDRGVERALGRLSASEDRTLHFYSKLIVGADGYDSILRRFSRVYPEAMGARQNFIFFEFETDMKLEQAIRLCFDDGKATALHPIRKGLARLSFQFDGPQLPVENRAKDRYFGDRHELGSGRLLSDALFAELVDSRVPWSIGSVGDITYRGIVPFERSYVRTPNVARTFLMGDAARAFGPLGSMSMNLGFIEAEHLVDAYESCRVEGTLQPLATLEKEMVMRWRALGEVEHLSLPSELADPWIATHRARILRSLPASGEALERLANQMFLHIRLHPMHFASRTVRSVF